MKLDQKTLKFLLDGRDNYKKEHANLVANAKAILREVMLEESVDGRAGRTSIEPTSVELAGHIIKKYQNHWAITDSPKFDSINYAIQ